MSCLKAPSVPDVPLPFPIVLSPPKVSGSVGFDANLCCKLLQFELTAPPFPIPSLVLNPAVLETMKAYIDQANEYLAKLKLDCPLE